MHTPTLVLWIKGCQLCRICKEYQIRFYIKYSTRDVSYLGMYIIPHVSYRETTRQFPDSNIKKNAWAYLGPIAISLLTWPPSPPSMPNIRWWCTLTTAEAKGTLGAIPMGLDATLDHYFYHPIILYPPSHPVHPSQTIPPSPQRLRRSPLPPSNLFWLII